MPTIIRKPVMRALLVGSNRCDAAGFTVRGRAPVTKLCRVLLKAGYHPDRPLHAYRGDTLTPSLRVRTIGEGAGLTVKTDGSGCPIFAPVKGAAAPLVDLSASDAPSINPRQHIESCTPMTPSDDGLVDCPSPDDGSP
jgi:hypothetical protein